MTVFYDTQLNHFSQVCEFAGTVERQDVIDAISAVNLYTANEQENQNATHGNNASEPDFASVNLVATCTEDNTSDIKSGALPVIIEAAPPAVKELAVKDEAAAADLKDNTSGGPKRRLSRQFSRDSQRSGNTCRNLLFFNCL